MKPTMTRGELRVIADTDHVQCGDAAAMANMLLELLAVPTFEEWCQRKEQKPVGWVREAMKEAYDGCRAAMLKEDKFVSTELQNDADLSTKPVAAAAVPDGWTANCDADAALVMLDRIDTIDCADDERIESVKNIIRRLAVAPEQ